jgi:Uncharacterized conserved protein
MLEKTARWARLFGIDSQIAKGEDSKILNAAISTKRILITRDKQLAERCRKKRAKCILLRSVDVAEQLAEIEFALRRMLFFFQIKIHAAQFATLNYRSSKKILSAISSRHQFIALTENSGSARVAIRRIGKAVIGRT